MGAHLPTLRGEPGLDLLHGDAVLHRADQPAKIAADTFHFIHTGNAGRRSRELRSIELGNGSDGDLRAVARRIEVNALMGAVPAGHIAEVAADTRIAIDPGDDLEIQV